MGITKKELKAIVKECLVEILAEGIGSSTGSAINEAKKVSAKATPSVSTVMRQNASRVKIQPPAPTAALKEAIRQNAGNNDVMAAILADTAATTLPTMLENDGSRSARPAPTGAAERVVASYAPEELFGEEAASKWADLAFMGMPNKG